MKLTFTPILFVGALGTMALLLSFSSGGQLQDYTGAPNGSGTCGNPGCHGNLTNGSGLTLSGIGNEYKPDSTYALTLTIDQSATRHGFQLTIVDAAGNSVGTLTGGSDNIVRAVGGRSLVQHQLAKPENSWEFTWQAPDSDVGELTVHMSGNAANGNGTTSGDAIYNQQQTLTAEDVSTSVGNVAQEDEQVKLIARSDNQLQVIDVPKNQRAIVVDLNGRLMKQLNLTAGENFISIQDLAKGFYFLRLEDTDQAAMPFVKP